MDFGGRRFWAKVEYDGTGFYGFQSQARGRTVQAELERALEVVSGVTTRLVGAGRTDRGVHAQGQIISFEMRWQHGLPDLQRALNAVLAVDVAVLEMGLAPEGFHPRFSALKRTYSYTVLNRPCRSPLERRTAWHVAQTLDLDRMVEASRCLVGTHDFATFGRPPRGGENTLRTVFRAEWQAQPEARGYSGARAGTRAGDRLRFDIEADAFLYRMVRSIVGTLVLVGCKQLSPEQFEAVLQARDRSLVKKVAPAHGLCLMRVEYAGWEGV